MEAARAGEAGAGFAVVADEVRNLAMRAADAAKDTTELIEGTVKKVKDGSQLVEITSEAFVKVSESTGKVGELVAEIAQASKEQSSGIDQVNTAIAEMDKTVQQNAANSEESASSSEEMSAQAEQMKEMVNSLVALISQNEQTVEKYSTGKIRTIATGINKTGAASKKRRVTKSNEIRPDQVIPFEEEDFKDF